MVGLRRRGVSGWHRNPMNVGMNVDAGSVRVCHPQRLTRSRRAQLLLDTWRHGGLLVSGISNDTNRPQAREGLTVNNFPNGDTPERATNDVTANSRDQVNSPGTKHHSHVGHLDLRPDLTISSHDASART